MNEYIKKFKKIAIADISAVRGKNSSLGEMLSNQLHNKLGRCRATSRERSIKNTEKYQVCICPGPSTVVKDYKITEYRITAKLSFEIEH